MRMSCARVFLNLVCSSTSGFSLNFLTVRETHFFQKISDGMLGNTSQYKCSSLNSPSLIQSPNLRLLKKITKRMASRGAFKSFMAWATNKEHGMLTTHFWGPVANWGLVGSAVYDASFQGPGGTFGRAL